MGLAEAVSIRPVRGRNSPDLPELLRVYEEAIPPSERKSAEAVEHMAERPDYRVLGAFIEERLVGFLAAYAFRQQPLSLLEYMAVSSNWRGHGIGSRLFGELLAIVGNGHPLVLEVESDRVRSADRLQRAARKRFYRRMGCREVAGLAYQLPLPGNPPPMDFLVHWPDQYRVPRSMIEQWLTALYVEVYGQSESDPRIPAMVAALSDPVSLM